MQQWINVIENYDGDESVSVLPGFQQQVTDTLEDGKVIFLPHLPFIIEPHEQICLSPTYLDSSTKNISLNPVTETLSGFVASEQQEQLLGHLMQRFKHAAKKLALNLCPSYTDFLEVGRTSFRPAEILGRKTSFRKDDTRLHVDAFPSSPTQGRRILRVFSNIHPHQQKRV
jgi:hypothetical protein